MIRDWPLIGRSEELQMIAAATRTVARHARGIVLSGAAGVGKTRLAREAVAVCGPRKARRHWIAGTTAARGVPLGAFADIATDFGPDPLRRVREVIDALVGDAGDAVVVGVDDAHLLDDLSAFAVGQLVTRRLATVVLTIRSGEALPDAITALLKDLDLERLELQPLSLPETADLMEHVLGGQLDSLSARRLWEFTQGNVLYLRHLVDGEVGAGRIVRHSGVWLWQGEPVLSPTLAELLAARIAQIPASVRDVLEALAVIEPLDIEVLAAIAEPDALAEAESLGLVRVDTGRRPALARLAHPMLGEILPTGSLGLRRLRGRIAAELGRKHASDPRDLIRRTVLTVDSDLAPDAELLVTAAVAAMQLGDQQLAETLARRAVAAGGGFDAQMLQAMANYSLERPTEVESILSELAERTSGPVRTQIAIMRAANFAVQLGEPSSAERELNQALLDKDVPQATAKTLRALIEFVRGHSRTAVELAPSSCPVDGFAQMLLAWTLVSALGDLGRIDDIEPTADRGYVVADESSEVSHLRIPLAAHQVNAYRRAGEISMSEATIARIQQDIRDVPFGESWRSVLAGMSAMSRGALEDARRSLRETLASLGTGDSGRLVRAWARSFLTTVSGMAGQASDARRELDAIEWWALDPDACHIDPERSLAQAWTCAAEGAVSQAITIARNAAAKESELDRPAQEAVLLQTATQFGDDTTAARLIELANVVQGPRAPVAAAHAAALAEANGDGLLDASRQYERFGDRVAAADAAAQAVVTYQEAGRRGAALSASATAQRLADECQGAQTPALRALTLPPPFTPRQREIISLAAQGLLNKEIAERLSMSVRSVEGHLLRASRRVGATGRDELISILEGT